MAASIRRLMDATYLSRFFFWKRPKRSYTGEVANFFLDSRCPDTGNGKYNISVCKDSILMQDVAFKSTAPCKSNYIFKRSKNRPKILRLHYCVRSMKVLIEIRGKENCVVHGFKIPVYFEAARPFSMNL